MNRKEIIEEINKLNLDKNEFWVVGSSSLVLRNILEESKDIDLAITNKEYESIKENLTYLGTNHNSEWYKLNDIIECCIDSFTKDKVEVEYPFNLIRLDYYYDNFLKDSTRDKDIEKKKLVDNILHSKGSD